MLLNQIVEKVPLLNRIDTLLVCEADFVGFKAAVLHKKGQTLSVLQHASAESLDMQEAVKELVDKLRKQGLKTQHAVLLTPAAFSTLVSLGVPPKNKLSTEQMAEAVRWELEPMLTQHQRVLSIGQIMLSNGYMNAEQVDQVLALQEADQTSQNREVMFKRFGEYAKDLKMITSLQLERALAKQAWFLGNIEQVQVNWMAQHQAEQDSERSYPWLVAGMSKPLLREWQAAFTQNGVKLLQCYPLTGAALLSVPFKQTATKDKNKKTTPEKPKALFDLQEGLLSGYVFNAQSQIQALTLSAHEPYLTKVSELYAMLGLDESAEVYLVNAASKTEQEATMLQDDIHQALQLKVTPIEKPSVNVSVNMRSVADHILLNKTPSLLVSVPVADPLPPLMQRFEVRAMLGAGLLIALIGFAELSLLARTYLIEADLEKIAPKAKEIDDAINKIKSDIELVKKYKEEVKEKTQKETQLQRNIELIDADMPKRNKMLIDFLGAFEQTVSEDVVIDRLAEDATFGFDITGWSISEQAAQEFVRKFQIAIHPLGYRLKNITVNQQTGRLGLLGYAINFKATSLDDKAWDEAKLGRNPNSAATKPAGAKK